MADREVKLKATTEGTEKAAKDFEKIAGAEKNVGGAASETAESTEKLNLNQEALFQTLNRINPALGGLAEGLSKAFVVAGDLATVNLTLDGVIGGVNKTVLKYKNSLLLLGAGGAAAGAVLFLISTWQRLNAQMEKAIENKQKLDALNRGGVDPRAKFGDEVNDALREGVLRPDFVGSDREAEAKKMFERLRQVLGDDDAFDRSIGKTEPLGPGVEDLLRERLGLSGVGRQERAERLHGGRASTKDVEAFARESGLSVDDAKRALQDIQREPISTGQRDAVEGYLKPIAEFFDELREFHEEWIRDLIGAEPLEVGRRGQFLTPEAAERESARMRMLRQMRDLEESRGSGTDGASAPLKEAAEDLRNAAGDLRSATSDNSVVADQLARERASRHVEPQAMDAIS